MYDFVPIAERMLATPSVSSDGTAEIVDYVLRTVIPELPGDATVMAEESRAPALNGVIVNLFLSFKERPPPKVISLRIRGQSHF